MIIPRGIQPDRSLYAIGATVIVVLKNQTKLEYDVDEIYFDFQKIHSVKVTINYFLYALDWLYLLELVDYGRTPNKIKKCF